jgi:hypothetical protein
VKKLMGQNCDVLNVSLRDKSRLKRGNDLWEKDFESVGQNLRNNPVDNVAKSNRSELVSCMRATELVNQSYKGVILTSQ